MAKIIPATLALFAVLFPALGSADEHSSPDLILVNGKIFTSSTSHPYVQALAIRGERILAVGTSQQISALSGPKTKRIDLGGRVVIPGINDAHYHLFLPRQGSRLHFNTWDPTWEEVRNKLSEAVAHAPKGTFIFAETGAALFEDAQANRGSLDGLAPHHPVVLHSLTGHYYILNTAALQRLGLKENEPDPLGGRFARGPDGKLNGVILEYAAFRLHSILDSLASEQDALESTRKFLNEAAQFGVTSVQDMSLMPPERLIVLLEKAPAHIHMRIMRVVLTDEHHRITEEARDVPRRPSPEITVSGTKYILDGTPVERTGAMRKPYADDPGTSGWMNFTQKDMEDILRESLRGDDQLLVHIMGDRTLEAFLSAMDATGGEAVWAKRRVRIEHGEGIMPDLLPRIKKLGIIVVQNPTHFAFPDLMARRFGPERIADIQPFRSLLDAGIPVAIGSDGPFNPYLNLMFATNVPKRPKESMTREQAVTAYTLTSAYAEFAEGDRGSLEPGKLADLAVLSQDIFEAQPQDLPKTESVMTIVAGSIIYDAYLISVR